MVIDSLYKRDSFIHTVMETFEEGKVFIGEFEEKKRDRSLAQNSLYYKWLTQRAVALHTSMMDQRCYCKLHFGVPILRRDNEEFQQTYDSVIKPLPYEKKLQAMKLIDISSIMGVKQMTEYLQEIEAECTEQGIRLVHPEDAYYEAMGYN